MENKTIKSFQDCRETDITGYNDCPSLLYVTKKQGTRQLVSKNADRSGNTKVATVPPPRMKRKVSDKMIKLNESNDGMNLMSKDQVQRAYEDLVSRETKLKEQEFLYYRRKVESGLDIGLEKESTRHVLGQVFGLIEDQKRAVEILTQWMLLDVTAGSWCTALRKLVENAVI